MNAISPKRAMTAKARAIIAKSSRVPANGGGGAVIFVVVFVIAVVVVLRAVELLTLPAMLMIEINSYKKSFS